MSTEWEIKTAYIHYDYNDEPGENMGCGAVVEAIRSTTDMEVKVEIRKGDQFVIDRIKPKTAEFHPIENDKEPFIGDYQDFRRIGTYRYDTHTKCGMPAPVKWSSMRRITAANAKSEVCPDCGKDNPFSGVKAGCETCKHKIESIAKEAEKDPSRDQIATIHTTRGSRVPRGTRQRTVTSTKIEIDVTNEAECDKIMKLLDG